ncbi:D-3-phosphoglycerate dehydrogenase [Bordetella ansorpii]|uniref:D-3-phosphoglycerate dehydrogenase n=1 Tax=Bordetella ansorpii TaxID=288768 RepID=A0A157NMJ4_9BORD|nr:hydroxyacid dehydrogenase [Bordetella ansorpii]SAI22505.1 D-3-phosphoglycerate dehydrogenase [Bordetella ansorpii]
MLIVISEFMDEAAVRALSARCTVRYEPDLVDRRDDLLAACADADALIVRNRTQVDAAVLAAAPRLRAVGRLGVGLDNIDLPGCAARDVQVLPATGANARAVAEYVVGTLLLLLRGAYVQSADVAGGKWPRNALSNGLEAEHRTLGIVGFGGIGRLTARLARGLDMTVVAHDPMLADDAPVWQETGVRPMPLDALLAHSDAVTLHLPLTPQTAGLFDAARLGTMKPGAILINTARGGVVDEAALAAALRSGALRGAAIDVFDQEPLPAGSPLADAPNAVLTPHIAGLTQEANVRVSTLVAQRVADALGLTL